MTIAAESLLQQPANFNLQQHIHCYIKIFSSGQDVGGNFIVLGAGHRRLQSWRKEGNSSANSL